jgi:hypothetical protein
LTLALALVLVACQGAVGSLTAEEASLCAAHSIVDGQLLREFWTDVSPELVRWLKHGGHSVADGGVVINGYYSGGAKVPDAVAAELDARCQLALPVIRAHAD